jgi:hypothetical protein
MRPSVEEQLQGTCRILEDVVAPCVNDPLARTLLDGVVANLRMLTAALPGVAPFLRQDNQTTGHLLAQLSSSVSPELAERVALALATPDPLVVAEGVPRAAVGDALVDAEVDSEKKAALWEGGADAEVAGEEERSCRGDVVTLPLSVGVVLVEDVALKAAVGGALASCNLIYRLWVLR